MFTIELPKISYHSGIDSWMSAPFGIAQTSVRRLVPQTEEALGLVEVEVVVSYPRLQPQEPLDPLKLRHRVFDQQVAIHH